VVRDLLVLSIDASRINDPEIAGEGERDRLKALAGRFSREDLLRAFDLLTRADTDMRASAQPRYHLEMALLRWIYLRKLVPIEDLIAGTIRPEQARPILRPVQPTTTASPAVTAATPSRVGAGSARPVPGDPRRPASAPLKDALLAEIRKSKAVFYNTVVAQAQKIEVTGDGVTFTFSPAQRALRDQFEQNRGWLESIAQQAGGRKIAVSSVQTDVETPVAAAAKDPVAGGSSDSTATRKSALREQALADAGVQALLEVFPVEIRDVEEM